MSGRLLMEASVLTTLLSRRRYEPCADELCATPITREQLNAFIRQDEERKTAASRPPPEDYRHKPPLSTALERWVVANSKRRMPNLDSNKRILTDGASAAWRRKKRDAVIRARAARASMPPPPKSTSTSLPRFGRPKSNDDGFAYGTETGFFSKDFMLPRLPKAVAAAWRRITTWLH